MDSLENILRQYGVTADYWSFPDDVQPTESAENTSTALEDVITASENWRDELLQAVDQAGQRTLPLFVGLADIRAENGNPETALKMYEAAVLDEDDPAALCELGYLLLQRCRIDELPLCDKDFDGAYIDVGSGETLLISSYMIDPENPGPEFPNKSALLNLAIRAFGLAYVRCVQAYFTEEGLAQTWDHAWHELVALEGLRAAFLNAGNLDALESVREPYRGWLEDYEQGNNMALHAYARKIAKERGLKGVPTGKIRMGDHWGSIERFVINLSNTEAYLQGRRGAASSPESEAGRHEVLSSALEAVHGRMDLIVDKLIDIDQRSELTWEQVRESAKKLPEAERANIRVRLEADLVDAWSKLDPESQNDLIDAEVFSAVCKKHRSGWRGAAIGYATATERELKKSVEYLRAQIPRAPIGKVETLGDLIEVLPGLGKWTRNDKRLSKAARLTSDSEYLRLHKLNNIRKRAAHPQKVSKADVLKMQRLLLRPRDDAEPLLAVIVQARDAS